MKSAGSFTDNLIETLLPRGTRRRDADRRVKRTARRMYQRINPDRSVRIFIACFPKSGSSYLTALLSEITGFTSRAIVAAYGHNEQDVSKIELEQLSHC
jgi:hypothetical protein